MNIDSGFIVIVILAVFFILWFLAGKRYNYRREKQIWSELSDIIKRHLEVRKVDYRGFGSSGYQLLINKPVEGFERYEVSIIMMDRENILHYMYQKIRGAGDVMIIKADLRRKVNLKLDVYNRRWRRVDGESIDDYPNIVFTGDDKGRRRLKSLLRIMRGYMDNLVYVSLSSNSPNLILTIYYDSNIVEDVIKSTLIIPKIV